MFQVSLKGAKVRKFFNNQKIFYHCAIIYGKMKKCETKEEKCNFIKKFA